MYEVLYHYSSPSFSLVEIKRLDLPDSFPKDKRYHWLRISHETGVVQRLTFEGMDDSCRIFSEGFLEMRGVFKTAAGSVILKKSETLVLDQKMNDIVLNYLLRA